MTPRGAGCDLLYLDFDGVLHPEAVFWGKRRGAYLGEDAVAAGHVLFEHANLLVRLLEPYSHIKVVLSTSWVRWYGFDRASKRLPSPLRRRVIGATFHSYMNENEFAQASRGMQVWGDVVRRQPRAWLALDDDWFDWPQWAVDNLVKTDEASGISSLPVISDLQAKLAAMAPHDAGAL